MQGKDQGASGCGWKCNPAEVTLQLHQLPLVLGHPVLGVDLVVGWLSFCQIVKTIHQGGVQALLESEAELQAIEVVGLLHKGPERVDVVIQGPLALPVLVLVLEGQRGGLGWVSREELLELLFECSPVRKPSDASRAPENPHCIGGSPFILHVGQDPRNLQLIREEVVTTELDVVPEDEVQDKVGWWSGMLWGGLGYGK
ncbi:hypothetical protein C0992_004931 [Termitomyces sp. T32_za158]|nr:hypothetical protein C0992_004931 [Termitomyces sp. T32_za158]